MYVLEHYYGYHAFRPQQEAIIQHVIDGGNAFVLMPTGGGKSLCYQIPAMCRHGVGVVISPLIALMQDQISALQQLGIRAAALNSSMDEKQQKQVEQALRAGELDMLYIAPERLGSGYVLNLLEQCSVALFAIDEAHCMSQWGHDFRPSYMALSVLAERFAHVPRIALTATADAPTRADIIERLGLQSGREFISGFDRPNIHYTINPRENLREQIWQVIQSHRGQCGIIYCISRNKVDTLTEWLQQKNIRALPYHAGLNTATRADNQAAFLQENEIVMVATIAFGMGIDKPNVRYVVHTGIPRNIEAYYQETGRAGRDGQPARAVMLYGLDDIAMHRHWISSSNAAEEQKHIEHSKLNALINLCEAHHCRRAQLLGYFGDTLHACGNCDNCNTPPATYDGTIHAQKALSCVHRAGNRFGVGHVVDILCGTSNEKMMTTKHHKLSTFGIGKELSKREWSHVFRQLVALNLLGVDVEAHNTLYVTLKGHAFLKEKQSIQLRSIPGQRIRSALEAGMRTSQNNTESVDEHLLNALKQTRDALAKEQNLPAYIIFHDKTLEDIAKRRPTTPAELILCHGVGETKLKRYGFAFLHTVKEH